MDFSAQWKRFLSESTDIQGGAFLTADGVLISEARFGSAEEDQETTVRYCAAAAATASQPTAYSERGEFETLILEGQQGIFVLMPVLDKAYLAVLVSKQARLGLVLLDMRRAIDAYFGPGLAAEAIFSPLPPKSGTAHTRPEHDE
jgi:uncharacterized protein